MSTALLSSHAYYAHNLVPLMHRLPPVMLQAGALLAAALLAGLALLA